MNTTISIYIDPSTSYALALKHTLQWIAINQNWQLSIVHNPSQKTDLSIDYSATPFESQWDFLNNTSVQPELLHSKTSPSSLRIEILPSIFYLVNCCQEMDFNPDNLDRFGRYPIKQSWQYQSNTLTQNIVQEFINQFVNGTGLNISKTPSQFFISHDIDFLYGSKKEDLKWASKHWRINDLLKIIWSEVIRKPHWRNVDRVIQLDNAYDIRATFFWLVNEGIGSDDVPNADYNFNKEKKFIDQISKNGHDHGLHKSASPMSLDEEINKSNYPWTYNRNHYLKFRTHDHWRKVAESKIELDCSLGFAEHYGFRNSFGQPFVPFDLERNQSYDFVETPLHVMDATFMHYLKTAPSQIGQEIISFLEENRFNCMLSILWHNNYCTDYFYKSFLQAYKEILGYIYENQFESIAPEEIINQYSINVDG